MRKILILAIAAVTLGASSYSIDDRKDSKKKAKAKKESCAKGKSCSKQKSKTAAL